MTSSFRRLLQAIVNGEFGLVAGLLTGTPELATVRLEAGATRQQASAFFFKDISHYALAGDTALHMAAAAFQPRIAKLLVGKGADCRARNRRGAEPLHYAADTNHWAPAAQRKTIEFLLAAGADPNARDNSGVAPLHRAIRTRSSKAVEALVAGGAAVHLQNTSGSTPFQLALQDTARSGAGSLRAREEQRKIIAFLLEAGAV